MGWGGLAWRVRLSHGRSVSRSALAGAARVPAWPMCPASGHRDPRDSGTLMARTVTVPHRRGWIPWRAGTRWAGRVSVAGEVEPRRELYDVVAHHLSLIAVRADAAPYWLAGTARSRRTTTPCQVAAAPQG